MHHGHYISSSASQKKPGLFRQILALVIALHIAVTPSGAASGEQLAAIPEFMGLAMAIANLNKAMRDAAENPMDEWRRQNVKHAMGMLPMAIRGLAGVFKAGKLHDDDLPMIQAMLGGFVDVNAPNAYKKFLANPDKRLIPKVGNGFPVAMESGAAGGGKGTESLYFNDSISKNGAGKGSADNTTTKSGAQAQSSDLVDVSAMTSASEKTFKTTTNAAGKTETESLVYDDSVKKGQDTAATRSKTSVSANASTGSRAPASAGSAAGETPAVSVIRVQPQAKPSLDEDFFQLPGKSKKGLGSKRDPANYERKVQPKYWSVVPFLRLIDNASAECQSGKCGGGQGGEGSGAKASDILFGLAAIMAAASPMVAASIQAKADKEIAQTNAEAQKAMTAMSADTSKYLADQQQQIAVGQAEIAAKMAADNQQATTERLEMQLAELNVARQEAAALEQKKFDYQQQLDNERVALAKAQANENQKLAAKQMRAQLAAAGLSQGFASTTNSAAGVSAQVGATGGTTIPKTTTAATGLGSAFAVANTTAATSAAKASLGASSRLLSSVGSSKKAVTKKTKTNSKSTTRTPASVAGGNSVEANPALRGVMDSQSLVRGSTSGAKVAEASANATSDLVKFTTVASKQSESFARSLAGEPHAKPKLSVPTLTAPKPSGHVQNSGAYNAPTDVNVSADARAFRGTVRSVYGGF